MGEKVKRYRFLRENEKERIYWDNLEGRYVTTSRKLDLYRDDDEVIDIDYDAPKQMERFESPFEDLVTHKEMEEGYTQRDVDLSLESKRRAMKDANVCNRKLKKIWNSSKKQSLSNSVFIENAMHAGFSLKQARQFLKECRGDWHP